MKKVFKSVAGSFALIPGIAIMVTAIGVPPDQSQVLWGSIVEVFGGITLLVILTNQNSIRRKSVRTITKFAIVGGCIAIISTMSYQFIHSTHVIKIPYYGNEGDETEVYYPLFPSNELEEWYVKGSKTKLVRDYGAVAMNNVITNTSQTGLIITSILMLLLYIIVFVSITFTFGILGIKTPKDG